ncbi:MAG: ribose 5-phosphate isomerase B [Chitinophagales bacterium]|nr:ribose 5-phosphate isomerase B [Chitinophagales bacterium]
MKTIAIASDHAGFNLKELLKKDYLKGKYTILDIGTHSSESCDYPIVAHEIAIEILKDNEVELGVLICGSGNGVAITANKHEHIRAALCWNEQIAILARQHNNANILCLPARFISNEDAITIVDCFLNTNFEGGRHQRRVDLIDITENC